MDIWDWLSVGSDLVTIVAFPLAILGFFHALRQYGYSQRAASASTLLALSNAFRESWHAFLTAPDSAQEDFYFAETINLVETACALHADGILYGKSKQLVESYLDEVIVLIADTQHQRFETLISGPNTFENLLAYRRERGLKRAN